MNKLCAVWKYTDVVGFKQKQWLSEEVFQNIIHIQTYNWTKYAVCESPVTGGLQAEAIGFKRSFSKHFFTFKHTIEQNMRDVEVHWLCGIQAEEMAFGRSFSKQYSHSNIQLNTVCALWNYTEWWVSSRSNSFQKKFLKRYTHSNIQSNKLCALWMYSEWWASSRSNGFREKFFKTLYTFKHTTEQSLRSAEVHWVVGFKHKQWLSGESFQNVINIQAHNWTNCSSVKVNWLVGFMQKQWLSDEFIRNIIHIQAYNWTEYALCESTLRVGLQAEAMAFRRSFSKHYTHSNIQMNKVCALWKYTEWWASIRSNCLRKKFFKTLYTFKHTTE